MKHMIIPLAFLLIVACEEEPVSSACAATNYNIQDLYNPVTVTITALDVPESNPVMFYAVIGNSVAPISRFTRPLSAGQDAEFTLRFAQPGEQYQIGVIECENYHGDSFYYTLTISEGERTVTEEKWLVGKMKKFTTKQ